jgi:hypothetical protein
MEQRCAAGKPVTIKMSGLPQCLITDYHGSLAKVTNANLRKMIHGIHINCVIWEGRKGLQDTKKAPRQSVDLVIEIRLLFGEINSQRWRIATPFREQLVAKPLSGW